jgi:hypothetical protein
MLFMNRLEFSRFTDFFVWIFKPIVKYGFLGKIPPVEGTLNSMEKKTRVFCLIDDHDFLLRYTVLVPLLKFSRIYIYIYFSQEASYEPELHPGVTYKLKQPKATLKVGIF